ncbi:hypothetical protein NRIC_29210 [Enterococcus florum]|uniref:Lipoprotein n=1 Tax=Enterococcus florum TaxID=2480627 RepID=A0A4P5PAN4_9ENTE|nr:hypothetical protein [Enterococcus florum]GCF95030.1 hypothetical protein NRIC_29210 [Enterococcus florum]
MCKGFRCVLLLILLFFLTACSSSISAQDLKANHWVLAQQDKSSDKRFIASFDDTIMTLSPESPSIEQVAPPSEERGQETLPETGSQFFAVQYEMTDNVIHLQNEVLELNDHYVVTKKADYLVLTPENSEEAKEIVLVPYETTDASQE